MCGGYSLEVFKGTLPINIHNMFMWINQKINIFYRKITLYLDVWMISVWPATFGPKVKRKGKSLVLFLSGEGVKRVTPQAGEANTCVRAEHSTYLTALNSLASFSHWSIVTGLCLFFASFSIVEASSLKSPCVPTKRNGVFWQWCVISGTHCNCINVIS